MRNTFANSTCSRWNADGSELTSYWPSKYSTIKLTLTRLISSSAHLITARTKLSSTQDRCLFVRVVKCWNRLPTSLVLSPSVSISKKHLERQWSDIFPAAPFLNSVHHHRHFFVRCNRRLFCFPYRQILTCLCCYCGPSWLILTSINKI